MTIFNSQMFFLGNFSDVDPNEFNAYSENASTLIGTYTNLPLIAVAVDDINNDGEIADNEAGATNEDFTYDTGAGTSSHLLDSTQTYNAQILLGDGSTTTIVVTVIQMENGDVFVTDYYNTGTLDNLNIQSLGLMSVAESNYIGFVSDSSVDNSSVVCFAAGTLIDTDIGPVPAENLQPGDLVRTLDHAYQPIRWVGHRAVKASTLAANPHLRPIIIRKGALGNVRQTRVSPQHGFLIEERLVRAKHLAEVFGSDVARRDSTSHGVTYVHILCDRHEIVFADGCATETLYPGPRTLQSLGHEAVTKMSEMCPKLLRIVKGNETVEAVYGLPARRYMSGRDVREWNLSTDQLSLLMASA